MTIKALSSRLLAFLIDGFAAQLISLLCFFGTLSNPFSFEERDVILLRFVLLFLYFTISEAFFNASVGKKLMGLLVGTKKNKIPFLALVALRNFLKLLSIYLWGIPFIFIFLNKEHKALHDILSGTIVYGRE